MHKKKQTKKTRKKLMNEEIIELIEDLQPMTISQKKNILAKIESLIKRKSE